MRASTALLEHRIQRVWRNACKQASVSESTVAKAVIRERPSYLSNDLCYEGIWSDDLTYTNVCLCVDSYKRRPTSIEAMLDKFVILLLIKRTTLFVENNIRRAQVLVHQRLILAAPETEQLLPLVRQHPRIKHQPRLHVQRPNTTEQVPLHPKNQLLAKLSRSRATPSDLTVYAEAFRFAGECMRGSLQLSSGGCGGADQAVCEMAFARLCRRRDVHMIFSGMLPTTEFSSASITGHQPLHRDDPSRAGRCDQRLRSCPGNRRQCRLACYRPRACTQNGPGSKHRVPVNLWDAVKHKVNDHRVPSKQAHSKSLPIKDKMPELRGAFAPYQFWTNCKLGTCALCFYSILEWGTKRILEAVQQDLVTMYGVSHPNVVALASQHPNWSLEEYFAKTRMQDVKRSSRDSHQWKFSSKPRGSRKEHARVGKDALKEIEHWESHGKLPKEVRGLAEAYCKICQVMGKHLL
ncbi:hypothetical protein SELMODRAFT_409347 [Selaginella moellendorffii]|uniref:Uncharacterized protein n=1 Tax=Selaginella moellendorffii TaxID=88036 RepID=D8RB60_SELML|nr:hypothetical protein SELMODRAFT_409347 [Selaginella moellendorffii]